MITGLQIPDLAVLCYSRTSGRRWQQSLGRTHSCEWMKLIRVFLQCEPLLLWFGVFTLYNISKVIEILLLKVIFVDFY